MKKNRKNRPSVRPEWEKTRRTECGTQSTGRGSGIECYSIHRVQYINTIYIYIYIRVDLLQPVVPTSHPVVAARVYEMVTCV
jgi:hypothetical protein